MEDPASNLVYPDIELDEVEGLLSSSCSLLSICEVYLMILLYLPVGNFAFIITVLIAGVLVRLLRLAGNKHYIFNNYFNKPRKDGDSDTLLIVRYAGASVIARAASSVLNHKDC